MKGYNVSIITADLGKIKAAARIMMAEKSSL